MLAATADRWGSDPLPGGKAVWAELGTGWRRSTGAASPLRSSAAPEFASASGAGAAAGRMVHMVAVPVRLLIESVRQFADLQREMQVVGLDHSGPKELIALAETNREISARIGGLRQAGADVAEAALARGQSIIDFDVEVADEAVEAFDRLGSLMRQMNGTLGRRHLLSIPPSGEVVAYRTWYRDEISSQLDGRAPRRCPFSPAPVAGT